MKAEIKEIEENTSSGINWSKKQLVTTEEGRIVLTTGESNGKTFSGFIIKDPDNLYPTVSYATNWLKSTFVLLPRSKQVILQND